MNTRYVPAVIMLLGGLVRCAFGIYYHDEFSISYALSLLLVLVIFYIIGVIVKEIIDKHIPPLEEENLETSEEEKELEDIQETMDDVSFTETEELE